MRRFEPGAGLFGTWTAAAALARPPGGDTARKAASACCRVSVTRTPTVGQQAAAARSTPSRDPAANQAGGSTWPFFLVAIIATVIALNSSRDSYRKRGSPSSRDRSFPRSIQNETRKIPSWNRGQSRTTRDAELSYGAFQWKDDRLTDARLASQRPGRPTDTPRDRARSVGELPERRSRRGISAEQMIDRMIRNASESLKRIEADRGALHKSRQRPAPPPAPPEQQP